MDRAKIPIKIKNGSAIKQFSQLYTETLNENCCTPDMVIKVGPQKLEYYCHRLMLISASEFLSTIISTTNYGTIPVLLLPDLSLTVIDYVLFYIYYGEVQVPSDVYKEFIDACKMLKLKGPFNILKDVFDEFVEDPSRKLPPKQMPPQQLPPKQMAPKITPPKPLPPKQMPMETEVAEEEEEVDMEDSIVDVVDIGEPKLNSTQDLDESIFSEIYKTQNNSTIHSATPSMNNTNKTPVESDENDSENEKSDDEDDDDNKEQQQDTEENESEEDVKPQIEPPKKVSKHDIDPDFNPNRPRATSPSGKRPGKKPKKFVPKQLEATPAIRKTAQQFLITCVKRAYGTLGIAQTIKVKAHIAASRLVIADNKILRGVHQCSFCSQPYNVTYRVSFSTGCIVFDNVVLKNHLKKKHPEKLDQAGKGTALDAFSGYSVGLRS